MKAEQLMEKADVTFASQNGCMHAGTAANVIPDTVVMGGSIR